MDSLRQHRDYLDAEWRALQQAPLSRRKAMLVAALVDAYVDRLFAADGAVEDVLAFRADIARRSPVLGSIMALCAGQAQLGTEAVEVPIAEYGSLAVEDFMVSLYNDHSVQRLRLVLPEGAGLDMLTVLRQAVEALDGVTAT